jgi:hypothetical protein
MSFNFILTYKESLFFIMFVFLRYRTHINQKGNYQNHYQR